MYLTPAMIIKSYFLVILPALLAMASFPARAQFVNFRLELPAGVNFGSQVISPNPENPKEQLVWIELVAFENMTILVDINNVTNGGNGNPSVFYLNDGSSDFAKASNIGMGAHSLQLHQDGLLIRNKLPKTINVKAWLGVSVQLGLVTKIEYP